jgi:hypothetical protein
MINLERWGKDLEKLIAQADTFEQRELRKTDREHAEALKKLESEHDAQKQHVIQEGKKVKAQIEQAALNKAAFMLYQDLQAGYAALQAATVPPVISEAEQARVNPFVAGIKANQGNEAVRIALETVAKSTFASEPALLQAVEFGISGKKEFPHITSYIGYEKGACHLIVPVDGEQNKELARDLETRILDVAGRDHFEVQRAGVFNREHQVEGIARDVIECTPETELVNKFLWYTLTLSGEDQARAHILQDAVIAKYDEVQASHPLASFAKLGITHSLAPLDGRVLAFFKAHSVKEINRPEFSIQGLREQGATAVPYEQVAAITGYTLAHCKALGRAGKFQETPEGLVMLDSIERYAQNHPTREAYVQGESRKPRAFNFTATDSEGIRQEALARLAQCGERLDTAQLQHVLGGMSSSGALLVGKKLEGTLRRGSAGGQEPNSYSSAGVRQYIETHMPRNASWYKPKEQ